MLTIKILGAGCPNCQRVESVARQAITQLGMQADFIKVTDYNEISNYPILTTPGLVINEQLVCAGRIPTQSEVIVWLTTALEAATP